MKRNHRIVLLFAALVFLTTYNPNYPNFFFLKNNLDFFKIKNVEITNNRLVKKEDIKLELKNILGQNILLLSKKDLENPLQKFVFIDRIEVKKSYPNTIKIKVYEERPIAILNKKDNKFFICETSKLIPLNKDLAFDLLSKRDLPSIFGDEAELYFLEFYQKLNFYQFPIAEIKNFYFFKIGRWDIELINDQIIKMPPTKLNEAISQSVRLLNRKDFKKYNIIDLRINGRIITQ